MTCWILLRCTLPPSSSKPRPAFLSRARVAHTGDPDRRHISERILADIGKLIARSTSSTTANLHDLYSALCEDEATWGFFKRMTGTSLAPRTLRR